jgi:3-hydroxyacyl-CoA dehydrogenase / enoyl-CoA hydratase / 3-hydroxybutyryl-CoA epimerase
MGRRDGLEVRWSRDEDDPLAIVTIDGESGGVPAGLGEALDWIERERDSLAGVVLCSAASVFRRDSDPSGVLSASLSHPPRLTGEIAPQAALLRRLESCGLPVAALIPGNAIGDGFGLALAAHRRIAVRASDVELGLPQVRLGLLPGRGALTRVVRLLGISEALTGVLAQGQLLDPERALKLGLVDELVDQPEELLAAAKRWIASEPDPRQPWDRDDYRMPGGTPSSPKLAQFLPAFPANLRKQLKGANYPAPLSIMAAAVEGAQLDFDDAVTVETRYLVHLICGQVAKNMVQAFHVDLKRIAASAERAGGGAEFRPRRVTVLGAGMMGAAIAYVAAAAGSEVVLRDVTIEAGERGKGYAETVVRRAVERGRSSAADGAALLARITPTAAIDDAGASDLVIEAVFEDAQLKASVLSEIDALQTPGSLIASNTSTLPISDLAEHVSRPDEFVGLHFFSPAERMPLLEIIAGRRTSPQTVARALEVARLFGKTPIVVNDSRGFFTSRVITMFLDEALAMLAEGVPAASIEQASLQAGYPAAALQLCDELSLELMRRIRNQYKAAAAAEGPAWETVPAEGVIDEMIDAHGRPGRTAGAGFYEYVDGKRTRLWPGLDALAAACEPIPPLRELEERMLFIESIESVKCRDEGVITTVAEANVGSILGIGFPAWTGGVLQYVNGYTGGPAGFVRRARELAGTYGPRFEPPISLVELAAGAGRLADPC